MSFGHRLIALRSFLTLGANNGPCLSYDISHCHLTQHCKTLNSLAANEQPSRRTSILLVMTQVNRMAPGIMGRVMCTRQTTVALYRLNGKTTVPRTATYPSAKHNVGTSRSRRTKMGRHIRLHASMRRFITKLHVRKCTPLAVNDMSPPDGYCTRLTHTHIQQTYSLRKGNAFAILQSSMSLPPILLRLFQQLLR